jgi:hypothetical protein
LTLSGIKLLGSERIGVILEKRKEGVISLRTFTINSQLVIEKINDHYCLVKRTGADKKNVEMCFYSIVDALAYSSERNYIK